MATQDREAAQSFFEEMYGETISEMARLVLWTSRDKRSTWTSSIGEAVAALESQPPLSNIYYGVCLQDFEAAQAERGRRVRKQDQAQPDMGFCRGYPATTLVMPGLWLDLDIAGRGHEKAQLPTSQVEAERILQGLPLDPSWVVDTGGGMHIYWLFREPWLLESEEERARAAALIRGWQRLAIDSAMELGYAVDSTHDLSRVLRPVGTINAKYGSVVGFRDRSEVRFNPSDFDEWMDLVTPVQRVRPAKIGDLSDDLQPPADKLAAMLALAPKFAETWRRERKEFPSQSEYDLSLATMAARQGWKENEIVALVVSHRRMGGEDLKLDRPGYYERLVGKARAGLDAETAHERLSDRVEMVQSGDADIEDEREDFLRDVSTLLGFKIRRIIKFVTDPPQYRLVLEEGQIHLGGVETILSPQKFRASIAAVSNTLIQRFQGARWDPVAQAILQAVEELDLGADSSTEGVMSEWLGEYLAQHRPSDDQAEAIGIKYPFIWKEGRICFFLAEFRSWLGFHRDEKVGRKQLATLLRTAGSEPVTVNYTREADGKRTTASCWTVPLSIAATLPARAERSEEALDEA